MSGRVLRGMRPTLRALASRQAGLVTRQQAIDAGYSAKEIRTNTRVNGPWVIVRRGVYAEREIAEAAPNWSDRMRRQDLAAHLMMKRPHLMSHDSAARLHELPMLRPDEPLVHVTRFGVGGSRTQEGVKHHLTRVGLFGAPQVGGVRVTDLARTALDIAREHGPLSGTAMCDAVLQRGINQADLDSQLQLMWSWPGVTRARAAVDLADPGAETLGESLTRMVLEELGLGPSQTQFPVCVRGRVYWVDLRVGRHLIEFDGKVKFLRRDAGGLADREISQVVWEEKRRQDAICWRRLGMSRVVWDELMGRQRSQLKRRLREEIQATNALFGAELPAEMIEFAARHRPARLARREER